jgi:hypothetical protein
MRKALILLFVVSGLVLTVSQALGASGQAGGTKTVTVVMRDPGCHWFAVGGKFTTKLSVKGPVALVNFDEAALKVAGPTGVRRAPIGKKVVLGRGSYRITMVGQAPDDNTLKLVVR